MFTVYSPSVLQSNKCFQLVQWQSKIRINFGCFSTSVHLNRFQHVIIHEQFPAAALFRIAGWTLVFIRKMLGTFACPGLALSKGFQVTPFLACCWPLGFTVKSSFSSSEEELQLSSSSEQLGCGGRAFLSLTFSLAWLCKNASGTSTSSSELSKYSSKSFACSTV